MAYQQQVISYGRVTIDRLETKNMIEFYEGVRLLRKKQLQRLRREMRNGKQRRSGGAITKGHPQENRAKEFKETNGDHHPRGWW